MDFSSHIVSILKPCTFKDIMTNVCQQVQVEGLGVAAKAAKFHKNAFRARHFFVSTLRGIEVHAVGWYPIRRSYEQHLY